MDQAGRGSTAHQALIPAQQLNPVEFHCHPLTIPEKVTTEIVARPTAVLAPPNLSFQEMSSLVSLNGDTKLIQAICAVVLKGHWMKLSKPEIASSLTSTHIHQVFDQMRVHGLRPHLHACTVLLNSLVKDRLTDMQIR
ncbi:hypothetical protein ACOSQ4_012154 [Xanthoceras sorbifolium]